MFLRVCASMPHPLQGSQLQSIQVPLSYLQQSIFGPLTEPVNGGAVDERWVLKDAVPIGKQPFMNFIICRYNDPYYSTVDTGSVN